MVTRGDETKVKYCWRNTAIQPETIGNGTIQKKSVWQQYHTKEEMTHCSEIVKSQSKRVIYKDVPTLTCGWHPHCLKCLLCHQLEDGIHSHHNNTISGTNIGHKLICATENSNSPFNYHCLWIREVMLVLQQRPVLYFAQEFLILLITILRRSLAKPAGLM